MSNLETLMSAGVVPKDHKLTEADRAVVESLSPDEVKIMVSLKTKLGDEFLRRNMSDSANFFL